MHIHYFNPFSIEKDFLKELDYYMSLVPLSHDWACFRDGDTMFVRGDYGNCIWEYVTRYPETGLFTCFASRCHYKIQVPDSTDMENPSISYHRNIADQLHEKFQLGQQADSINRRIAGHMLMLRKSTWLKIRPAVFGLVRLKNKKILGVDTQISKAVLQAGMDIKLMKGIYLVHYLRFNEGIGNHNHLL
jgi:hypothetical protein